MKLRLDNAPSPIRLKLRRDSQGMVDLVAEDLEGHHVCYLVGFHPDGTAARYGCIPDHLGLPLDEHGQLDFDYKI